MSLKNIITAAVFAVIGFIVMLGAGMAVTVFGTMGAFYLNVSFATILGAPIYVVLLKKVPAHGVAGIFLSCARNCLFAHGLSSYDDGVYRCCYLI
ncbi:MAG: MptD family putative ECF transporter S component [Atopobium sp.]|uniref:MptD family putative ECF transporter S component n=1 Tax=Atopobium sp. TaxID=1872650 RepID=UPI002A7EC9C7|nr:MptD family putative ECF transporter S component [Atopobium sp.]MDY4523059.1 MptD family putative ECF transporter S component [Atopobium sp.]